MIYQVRTNQAEDLPTGKTRVFGNCLFTGEQYEVTVPTAGIKQWIAGELIQNALPGVSISNREFLISGISPTGWKSTFG